MTQFFVPVDTARELCYEFAPMTIPADWPELLDLGVRHLVENRIASAEEWTATYELVFRTEDGKFWRRLYRKSHDHERAPFDGEGPLIPFDEVTCEVVSSFVYEPVRGK